MRSIVIVLAFLAVAIASGVFSTMLRAQEPPTFFATEQDTSSLEQQVAALEKLVADLKSCQCQCDCGKQKAAEQPAQPRWKITMVSKNNCPACPPAKAYHEPRYKGMNWDWSERSDYDGKPGMSYPYYEVCLGDSCVIVQCGIYELDGVIADLIAQRNQQPVQNKRGRFLGNW